MLVARRDPFHPAAHDAPFSQDIGGASRLTRTVSMIQVVGSLLAIPVGLGSAYSIYRANFSTEINCQSLRAGIVSMLNKSVDAATQRMLVRRDVEAFERTCGSVDPDATAAFRALLGADTVAASPSTVAAPVASAPQGTAQPKPAVRKAEPHPQVAAKPAAKPASAAAEVAHRDAAVSDTQWVDAVRQALVTHAEPPAVEINKVPAAPAPPAQQEATLPVHAPPVAALPAAPVVSTVAPELPPAAVIATPAAPPAEPDHPVPPGAIPDPAETAAAKTDEQHRSTVRKWIAKVPLVGSIVENGL